MVCCVRLLCPASSKHEAAYTFVRIRKLVYSSNRANSSNCRAANEPLFSILKENLITLLKLILLCVKSEFPSFFSSCFDRTTLAHIHVHDPATIKRPTFYFGLSKRATPLLLVTNSTIIRSSTFQFSLWATLDT